MSGPVDVRPIANRREFRRFIDHPYEQHATEPHWIPPLRLSERDRLTPRKNPFFAHAEVNLLLAWRGRNVVGRVAAIDDRLHNETHRDEVAMFGFFEAVDAAVARSLLASVEAWARQRGRRLVRGPINPSLHESAGLLIDGFETDPMVMMPHNPKVYAEYIEAAGYRKVKDLYAWLYALRQPVPPAIARVAARVKAKHRISTRALEIGEFGREVERMRTIYCGAWERNWGFVPPTKEEFVRIATELKPILDPRCTICAEVDGRFVGCAIAVPDINQALKGTNGRLLPLGLIRLLGRRFLVDRIRVLLVGILSEYRRVGLYPLLWSELQRQVAEQTRYLWAEMSWVLEDNADVNQPLEQTGAQRYKTYRIYQKGIVP